MVARSIESEASSDPRTTCVVSLALWYRCTRGPCVVLMLNNRIAIGTEAPLTYSFLVANYIGGM